MKIFLLIGTTCGECGCERRTFLRAATLSAQQKDLDRMLELVFEKTACKNIVASCEPLNMGSRFQEGQILIVTRINEVIPPPEKRM